MSEKKKSAVPAEAVSRADASPLDTVSGLMDERRKYEGWLAALEARRAETPERVFVRVHADYTTRLETVVHELTSHADGLRAEVGSLTSRGAELDEEQQRLRDERAEAELRAHVGELSDSAWQETAAASDAALTAIAARRSAIDDELSRTRELLGEAERPPARRSVEQAAPSEAIEREVELMQPRASGATSAVADVPDAEVRAPAAETRQSGATGRMTPATAQPAVPDDVGAMTELTPETLAAEAQLIDAGATVEDLAKGDAEPTRAGGSETQPRRSVRPGSGSFDELAFLSSVVDTPAGTLDTAPAEPGGEKERRDSFAMRAQEESTEKLSGRHTPALGGDQLMGEPPLAMNVTGNIPIVLREKPAEGKSLKCGECGAMNLPTEWYCEKCGAELASL